VVDDIITVIGWLGKSNCCSIVFSFFVCLITVIAGSVGKCQFGVPWIIELNELRWDH
jgi:hypothetical protein